MRTVLAIDLGAALGWASLRGPVLRHGMRKLKDQVKGKTSHRARIVSADVVLRELMLPIAFGGDLVFETSVGAYHNPLLVAGHLQAVMHLAAEFRGVPEDRVFGYAPKTIKLFAAGKGNASKAEMVSAVRKRWALVEDHNEADAVALIYCHLSAQRTKGARDG